MQSFACSVLVTNGAPVAVSIRADKVSVDDAQREDERSKGLQIQQEWLADCPANKDHHRQHEDGDLRGSLLNLKTSWQLSGLHRECRASTDGQQ